MAPRLLHQQLPYPDGKSSGTAASQRHSSLEHHSTLNGPFLLDVGDDRDMLKFLLKLKLKIDWEQLSGIHSTSNFSLLTFGEILQGSILLGRVLHFWFGRTVCWDYMGHWISALCFLLNLLFPLDYKCQRSPALFQHCCRVLLDYLSSTTNKLFYMLYICVCVF